MSRQMDKQENGPTGGWEKVDGWTVVKEHTNRQISRQTEGWIDRQTDG